MLFRSGIRLQWVYWGRNSEVALRDKVVDLWPLMTVTPERLQHLYISEPYLEAEFCLLVRADSPYTKMQDLANGVISFADRPVDSWQLDGHLPHVRKLSRWDRSEVMEDLCQRRADAAFMNAFTGIATLLDTRGVCGEQPLRWRKALLIRRPDQPGKWRQPHPIGSPSARSSLSAFSRFSRRSRKSTMPAYLM